MKRSEVRRVDKIAIEQYGISGLVLMENAGRGAAERISERCDDDSPVCILCGTGNNGGDGYVIARHLQLLGCDVRILSLVSLEKLSGDAQANATIAQKAEISITVAKSSDDLDRLIRSGETVVDCLLGTGATGQPRGLYGDAVRIANEKSGRRIAIDLPTGLDCDTGQPSEMTFRADLTITFVAPKDGFACENATPYLGNVEVVGIGVPLLLLKQFGVASANGKDEPGD